MKSHAHKEDGLLFIVTIGLYLLYPLLRIRQGPSLTKVKFWDSSTTKIHTVSLALFSDLFYVAKS